jgi:hypothetical protein
MWVSVSMRIMQACLRALFWPASQRDISLPSAPFWIDSYRSDKLLSINLIR